MLLQGGPPLNGVIREGFSEWLTDVRVRRRRRNEPWKNQQKNVPGFGNSKCRDTEMGKNLVYSGSRGSPCLVQER